MLHDKQDHSGLRMLEELRHPSVCHAWLWHLDFTEGTVLSDTDFTFAVRHRLGAAFVAEPVQRRACGKCMSLTAAHGLCCAIGESTAGHYTVFRALEDGLRVAEAAVVTEVRGLVENSSAHPADAFTGAALPGRDAALDVTIAAKDVTGAGDDCCVIAFRGNMRKYAKLLGPMAKEGVGFRPLVWSAEGRAHPVVTRALTYAAEQASRKHEDVCAKTFLQRWRRDIAVAIEKRLARMLKACLPAPSRRSRQLLWGRCA